MAVLNLLKTDLVDKKRRMLDVSLAKEIDFTAMTSLEKGIEQTIKYFYENIDKILLK